MTEAKIKITAEDNASNVIDQVAKRLGVFNKEGLAVGVTFALVNKGIDLLQQELSSIIEYVQKGTEANRQFELSLTRLSVSTNDLGISINSLKSSIESLSVLFITDVNTLTVALQDFIREGYNVAQAEKLLYETGKLMTAANEDLTTTQHALNTIMQVFKLSVNDAEKATNVLYQISKNTDLSLSDVDRLLSRTALSIQKYGINIDSVANAYYTLEKTGTDLKGMTTELNDAFKDLNISALKQITNISNLDTSYKEITKTTFFISEQQKKITEILQMRHTEQMDISKFFDINMWNEAVKKVEELQKIGIDTVEEFNATQIKPWWDKDIWDILVTHRTEKLEELIRTMIYAKELDNKIVSDIPVSAPTPVISMDELETNIKNISTNIVDYRQELENLDRELERTQIQKEYTVAMREATLAVQEQEDAIDKLQRTADKYNLQSQENTLEIMKIQYGAMGRRRGLTRGESAQIKEIEKENALLRIQEMEQQIKIGNIQQNGLQNAMNNMESIRREHDSEMYRQEIEDLDIQTANIYNMWLEKNTLLNDANIELEKLNDEHRSRELNKTKIWANKMRYEFLKAYGVDFLGDIQTGRLSTGIARVLANGMSQNVIDSSGVSNYRLR